MSDGIEIIYDGACPFCTRYVALVRLRQAVGEVTLIDARSGDPRVAEVQAAGHDLDEGMVVRHGETIHHGAEAMRFLSLMSSAGASGRLMRLLFADPSRAARLYPIFVATRRATLRLLRRNRLVAQTGERRG